MIREERISLDPAELDTGDRAELDLHTGPIQVRETGVDWGQAEIEASMAQHEMGEYPVDFRLPNRVITIPLLLGAEGDYDAARIALQAKVSRINEEGGWLKRELIGGSYGEAGSSLYCDLVKATLNYGGSTFAASNGVDPDAELVLEALPDFYGEPVEEALFEGTGDATATFQVKGNLPGRVDLAAYEESANNQRGLAWGFRCRNYSSASSARLAYSASSLKPLDQALQVSLSGAYGGKAIYHSKLGTEWTPVLDNTTSGTYPTHVGLYDVWARVFVPAAENPKLPWVRLVYDVGDLIEPTNNDPARVPGAGSFYLVNLGQVNLREAPIGRHRWIGLVQARGEEAGARIYVDRLWYLPADEGSGVLRAASSHEMGVGGFTARDRFGEGEGVLTGRAAEYGGTYVAYSGSDTTDFQVSVMSKYAYRTAVSDTGTIGSTWGGRAVGLSSAIGSTAFAYTFRFTGDTTNVRFGQLVRASAGSKFILVYFIRIPSYEAPGEQRWFPRVYKQKGVGLGSLIAVPFDTMLTFAPGAEITGRILVTVVGDQLTVMAAPPDSSSYEPLLSLRDADLAGELASGGIYVYDQNTGVPACTRYYTNLAAWVPDSDAVLFAGRNARLMSEGMFRQHSDGSAYGRVSYGRSDLPRVPISGPESRPVEALLKPSRGNFENLPDTGIDKVKARLTYRPCWSNAPE